MKIVYPDYSRSIFPMSVLEVRVDGLRKGAIAPGKEIEIDYPEKKTVAIKLGLIAKHEFLAADGATYRIKDNWGLRNFSWVSFAMVLLVPVLISVFIDFDKENWWLIMLAIISIYPIFYFVLIRSRMLKIEVEKV